MNAWDTIEKVRKELKQAEIDATGRHPKAANRCLQVAMELLYKHITNATGPDYGFEGVKP